MFNKTLGALGVAATLAFAGATPSQAAMPGQALLSPGTPLVQNAQFFFNPLDLFFGGHDWCWYDDGWRGDGWYWCGYGNRDGYGYGGGEGFHGWREHRYERDWHGGGRHRDGGMEHHEGGMHHQDGGMHHHEGGMQHHNGGMQHQGGQHNNGGNGEHHHQ